MLSCELGKVLLPVGKFPVGLAAWEGAGLFPGHAVDMVDDLAGAAPYLGLFSSSLYVHLLGMEY